MYSQRKTYGQVHKAKQQAFQTLRSFFPKLNPFVPFSTNIHDIPDGPVPPVRHMTKLTSVSPPPLINAYEASDMEVKFSQ